MDELALSLYDNLDTSSFNSIHFAFGLRRSKIIDIGFNDPNVPSPKARRLGRLFNVKRLIKYPYLHAETDLLCKLLRKNVDLKRIKMYIVRVNKNRQIVDSKPCDECQSVLKHFNFKSIEWSKDA